MDSPVPVSPTSYPNSNDQHRHPPDESRSRWEEYESKSADMALFRLHTNATTHHPKEPYDRSISHDSIFAMASTPPWGNTTLNIGATGGQDNDSVDLTIFIDDDQSTATELCPIYRVRPSIVPMPLNEEEEEEKGGEEEDRAPLERSDNRQAGQAVSNENYRGTKGYRSSHRRSHSGGLDPYLLPPPRFTRFEI